MYFGFPCGAVVKNLSVQEFLVWSLGQEDPLEKEMASRSCILAWKEEIGRPQFMGWLKSQMWLKKLQQYMHFT